MTNTNTDLRSFLEDLARFVSEYAENLDGPAAAIETPAPRRAKAKPVIEEPEQEEDEDEDDGFDPDRKAELEDMTVAALKKLAQKLGYPKSEVEDASKDDLVLTILADEAEAEEEDEEDADEEDETDGEYTRTDLEKLGLVALKKIAKDEFDQTTDSLKGLDKEAVIDLILGEEAEEAEEEEEEEEDDTEEEITEEYLNGLSLAELKAKAKQWGYTVKPGMKRDAITDLFFEE
jgi:hypothetical protein